jgi:hypothetical protein
MPVRVKPELDWKKTKVRTQLQLFEAVWCEL